ncbi:Archease protein family-domain-containing protein [Ostreococcus tauri]|uniref:Archease protein family-domain-containing protein n=1 Tax=Ostreococcus tauri TaxID=70448 RepID=A0A1Y5I2I3_OSTTA|nr:Archease protein family-domain-containing protein [Ostreococcus tauri]
MPTTELEGVAHEVLPKREPRAKRRRRDGSDGAETRTTSERDGGDEGESGGARADAREGFEPIARVTRYASEREDGGPEAETRAEESEDEIRARRGVKYEYKDHTADIQIHAWGDDLAEAYAWAALGMFDYMTPLEDCVGAPQMRYREIRASGHDLDTLLFAFLDELLFTFHTEMLICTAVQVCEFNRDAWTIRAVVGGTTFVDGQTRQGTEIKAITYSAMKIIERETSTDAEGHRAELFVIVDI